MADREPIPIRVEELTELINSGMKKKELAEHYGLPVAQMTKVLQQTGLRIRKFHRPKFVIIEVENLIEESVETPIEERVEEVLRENLPPEWTASVPDNIPSEFETLDNLSSTEPTSDVVIEGIVEEIIETPTAESSSDGADSEW